jgi:hypothetical protein
MVWAAGMITALLGWVLAISPLTRYAGSVLWYGGQEFLIHSILVFIWSLSLLIFFIGIRKTVYRSIGIVSTLPALGAFVFSGWILVDIFTSGSDMIANRNVITLHWEMGTLALGVTLLMTGLLYYDRSKSEHEHRHIFIATAIAFGAIGIFGFLVGISTGFGSIHLFDSSTLPWVSALSIIPCILGLAPLTKYYQKRIN